MLSSSSSSSLPSPSPLLSVATYGGQLFGWSIASAADGGVSGKLEYAFSAADGPIQCLAASGGTLVAASAESILLFDVRRRRQVGSLMHHSDTVTSLAFAGDSAMLSADRQGSICIWDTRSWSPGLSLRGHRCPVADIAVHPSGKVALSAGTDGTVRLWDLTKGKPVHTMQHGPPADAPGAGGVVAVSWVPDASGFLVCTNSSATLYGSATGEVECEWMIPAPDKLLCSSLCPTTAEAGSGSGWSAFVGTEAGNLLELRRKAEGKSVVDTLSSATKGRNKRVVHVANDRSGQPVLACVGGTGIVDLWSSQVVRQRGKPAGKTGAEAAAAAAAVVDLQTPVCSLRDASGVRPTAAVAHSAPGGAS